MSSTATAAAEGNLAPGGSASAALTGRRRPRTRTRRSDNWAGYLFLLPWFAGLLLIVIGPMAASLYLSFTDYSGGGSPDWVGLSNYTTAFSADPRFWAAVKVTLIYVVVGVPVVVVFALGLALMLNKGIHALSVYRAVFYVPSLIGGSVAVALLWRQVFGANGMLNQLLGVVGINSTDSWIGNPSTALSTLVVLHAWQFGSAMIIFLAGLRQIPLSLYEAAKVDGASWWRQLRSVTLPMLSPIILFNTLLGTIGAFQSFNSAYIISAGTGGPANSTLFYTLYLYQRGFVDFRFGYASALGWLLILSIATVTGLIFLVSRRWVHYGE